jgi:hypothetical protein
MTMANRVGKLVSLGVLSGALTLASGCGKYGVFSVEGVFGNPNVSANDNVEHCQLTIEDADKGIVIESYVLPIPGACGDKSNTGDPLSYSTSATSGTLNFIICGTDNTGKDIEQGEQSAAIRVYNSQSDAVGVTVQINACPAGGCTYCPTK